MKNKVKGLLALVLSVLIGQVWAADATLDTDVSKAIRQALDVSDGKSVSIAMRLSFKEAAANLETDATFASLTVQSIGNGEDIKNQGNGAHLHAYSANHGIGGNIGNGGSGTWLANNDPVGLGSHVVVFVVSPEGSDDGKVTLTSYADGKILKRDTQSTFANYPPTDGNVYFNTAKNDELWTYESVTYFEKALTAEEVKNLSLFMGRGETISLNFASGKENGLVADGTVSGLVSAKGWMNLAGANGSGEKVTICDGESLISEFPVTYSFESATTWNWNAGTENNCNYINGYLDDGTHNGVNGPTINISKIPFSQYSIIVYTATDTGNGAFRPIFINGISYKGSSELTSVGYAVASTDNWGRSQTTSAVYGTNALRVDGLSGNLTIQGGGKSGNNRGCIAAIQIVNTGVIFDANGQQTIDWSENEAPKTSELPELLKYNVELTLSGGATLVVDSVDAIKNLHKIYIKSPGSVTVQVTDITVGSTELGLVFDTQNVEGGVIYTYDYTEKLGYTKDDVTYPLIFLGTTDANWATLSNWYIGTRTQGETTYWISYTNTKSPGLEGSNEWRDTLVDGELMAVEAGADGKKTITIPTSPRYEGWAPNITVCNGVHVVIEKMRKMQSNTESGPSNISVDDTSKITVTTFDAESACDGEHKFYVNAKDGVNFDCPNQSGKLFKPSVSYYFDDDGSVNLGYVSGRQTVEEVKLNLGDSSFQGKTIVSRKLIGFSGTATCSYVEVGVSSTSGADVAPLAEGSALEDADVGTYQFSVEDDGYYVNYVAYAPVAKIGDVEYATLGAAVAAAANGAIITVLNDCTADTAIVIADKALTIDLNGKTVKSTGNDGNGVFWVKNDGVLTLEDSSEAKTGTVDGNGTSEYKMAIWADGGSVVINGGNYINVNNGPDDQYDLIYVKHGGSIEINGGTFVCQTPRWTLNSHNTEKGTFEVKGGTFKDFNPAEVDTDDNVTTWCAEGYTAAQGQDGYWTVAAIPVSNNVAKIGETEYETLELAFEAAATMTGPVTVTLLKDVGSEAEAAPVVSIPEGFNGTLDLDGKTLYSRIVASKAMVALTVQNGNILHRTGSAAAIDIKVSGLLTLNDVYLETSYHGVRLRKNAKGVINSGDYRLVDTSESTFNLLYLSDAPTGGDPASLIINGGDFYSRYKGTPYVMIRAGIGDVTINNGVFHAYLPGTTSQAWCIATETGRPTYINGGDFREFSKERIFKASKASSVKEVYYEGGMFSFDPVADATTNLHLGQMEAGYHAVMLEGDDFYTVVEKPVIQLTIDFGEGVSSVNYTIAGNTTPITEDTTIDIAESGTVVSFAVVADDGYFAPTVADVTVTQTTTVTIAGVAFSAVESADAAITADNRDAVYAWAKSNGKSQSEVSAANYLYADYLFNFAEFSAAEPTIEITEFSADPLVIKAKVTVNGETKIADLSATGLNLNGTLKYKAAATLEALEDATPKAALEATDRFFKVVVE